MLEDPSSMQRVRSGEGCRIQIVTTPLQDRPTGVFNTRVGVILFGDMVTAATQKRVNETGANLGRKVSRLGANAVVRMSRL
jgi:hypothetical protein